MLVSEVAKILTQEVIGYNANISGYGSAGSSGMYATAGCAFPNQLTAEGLGCTKEPELRHHVALEIWGLQKIAAFQSQFPGLRELVCEDLGSLGYSGVEGLYVKEYIYIYIYTYV